MLAPFQQVRVCVPKSAGGTVEAIRMVSVARRSAVKARTQAANQINGLVVSAPSTSKTITGPSNTETDPETETETQPKKPTNVP